MPSLPVKVYRNNEIRRFRLETGDEDGRFGFNRMVNKINHLFPDLENNVRLTWKDTDGEFVTMGSNPELREAVQNLPAEDQVLRVYILEKNSEKSEEKPQEPVAEEQNDQTTQVEVEIEIPIERDESAKTEEPVDEDPTLHRYVVCDVCEGAIRGIRFKCLTCPDYDLCVECMEKAPHDEHPTIRITSPIDHSWKRAFIASQGFANFFPGRRFGSGRCPGRRCRRWAEKCQQNQEAQKPEEPKEPEPKEDAQPGLFSEEMINDLTKNIESVLAVFGIPVTAQTEATPKQENATAPAKEEKTEGAAPTEAQTDPKIAAALNYMLAMGYRNDGGWLTKLLEEKRGDVSAVLDILHPNPNPNPNHK